MTTLHERMHLPGKLRATLLASSAYIESAGKTDIATLADVATAPNGVGTVLRLILGATTLMPLRALTYVESALRTATILPCEQIQIVHANRLGGHINGVDQVKARETAAGLADLVRRRVQTHFPTLEDQVLHASDTEVALRSFAALSEKAFVANPEIAHKLTQKGAKHGGDAGRYASAHFVFQDTDVLELEPLVAGAPDQVEATRVVSIGCQQERTFYLARMAMRASAIGTDIEPLLLPSAQLFTRHLTPPYFIAQGGEPMLPDATFETLCLDDVGDRPAQRDLAHFMLTNHIGDFTHA